MPSPSVLPPTALPYIPSVLSPGDSITVRGLVRFTRDERGRWSSPMVPCCSERVTDAVVKRMYTDPVAVTQFGVPMFAPAPVPADEPLPGRPVVVGEQPFEDRLYLMAGDRGGRFQAFAGDVGPWGTAQLACTPKAPEGPSAWTYELSLTDTGVVWYRAYGLSVAYVPAELPSDEDAVDLLSVAVVLAAFSDVADVIHI